MKIINHINSKLLKEPSNICFVGAYQCLLSNTGMDVSEGYLYVMSEGLTFEYNYIHKNTYSKQFICEDDLPCVVGTRDIREKIYNNWEILINDKIFQDNESARLFIERQLLENHIILVHCDTFELFYHPLYRKQHATSIIVVYGIDTSQDVYHIVDRYIPTVPTTVYSGAINRNELIKALCSGEELTYEKTIQVIYCETKGVVDKCNLREAVLNVCRDMLLSNIEYKGIQGISFWANEVLNWGKYWDDNRIKYIFLKCYLYLKNRGGPMVSRKIYFEYLLIHDKEEKNSESMISELLNTWVSITALFMRLAIRGKKDEDLQRINYLLELAAKKEKELFSYFNSLYSI